MDITNVALTLGIAAPGVGGPSLAIALAEAPAPSPATSGEHAPATAPPGIPAPPWWKGDKAAFAASVGAAKELGMGVGDGGD